MSNLAIKLDLIPKSASNRPGTLLNATYITVHETANTKEGTDAESHARYVKGDDAAKRQVSWHYTVDEGQIIQHLPVNERGWHAGSTGNATSVGIELCVNSDGNFDKTRERAIQLIKSLQAQLNIPNDRVVSHKHWTGKNCPTNLLKVWGDFKAEIAGTSKPVKTGGTQVTAPSKPAPAPAKGKTVAQMADEVEKGLHGNGHDNRRKSLGVSQSVYDQVSAEVNRRAGVSAPNKPAPAKPKGKSVAQMADEVEKGLHGNGHGNRRKSLGVSQSVYNQVSAEVNRRAGSSKPKGKSIKQMADEIIAKKHGDGHAARQKSLGIDNATYAQVRKEVNSRF